MIPFANGTRTVKLADCVPRINGEMCVRCIVSVHDLIQVRFRGSRQDSFPGRSLGLGELLFLTKSLAQNAIMKRRYLKGIA